MVLQLKLEESLNTEEMYYCTFGHNESKREANSIRHKIAYSFVPVNRIFYPHVDTFCKLTVCFTDDFHKHKYGCIANERLTASNE